MILRSITHDHSASLQLKTKEPCCHRDLIHVGDCDSLFLLWSSEEHGIDARAIVRLQADHASRTLVPAFYRYLQAQDPGSYPRVRQKDETLI